MDISFLLYWLHFSWLGYSSMNIAMSGHHYFFITYLCYKIKPLIVNTQEIYTPPNVKTFYGSIWIFNIMKRFLRCEHPLKWTLCFGCSQKDMYLIIDLNHEVPIVYVISHIQLLFRCETSTKHAVQIFNSCTSRPDVCQCLVV